MLLLWLILSLVNGAPAGAEEKPAEGQAAPAAATVPAPAATTAPSPAPSVSPVPAKDLPPIKARIAQDAPAGDEFAAAMHWDAAEFDVREKPEAPGEPYVELKGHLGQGWTLLVGERVVPVDAAKGGAFDLQVPLTGPLTQQALIGVDEVGTLKKVTINLFIEKAQWDARGYRAKARTPRRYSITPSAGLSLIHYTQDAKSDISAKAMTVKVSALYFLAPPRWDLGMTGYVTAVPLSTSMAGVNLQFLGLNARIGYALPMIPEPWRVSIMGGIYYTTMKASSGKFGFEGMMGPQVFPTVRWILENGDSVNGYAKIAMVGNAGALFDLKNRELAGGVSYSLLLSNGHPITVSADLANLSVTSGNHRIRVDSMSFGVGYAF